MIRKPAARVRRTPRRCFLFAHPWTVGDAAGALRECSVSFSDLSSHSPRCGGSLRWLPQPRGVGALRSVDREAFAQRWPESLPYGGAYSTSVPHLTVAHRVAADVVDALEAERAAHLPLRCRATEAWSAAFLRMCWIPGRLVTVAAAARNRRCRTGEPHVQAQHQRDRRRWLTP
jgi:hypothetical protein